MPLPSHPCPSPQFRDRTRSRRSHAAEIITSPNFPNPRAPGSDSSSSGSDTSSEDTPKYKLAHHGDHSASTAKHEVLQDANIETFVHWRRESQTWLWTQGVRDATVAAIVSRSAAAMARFSHCVEDASLEERRCADVSREVHLEKAAEWTAKYARFGTFGRSFSDRLARGARGVFDDRERGRDSEETRIVVLGLEDEEWEDEDGEPVYKYAEPLCEALMRSFRGVRVERLFYKGDRPCVVRDVDSRYASLEVVGHAKRDGDDLERPAVFFNGVYIMDDECAVADEDAEDEDDEECAVLDPDPLEF